VRRPADNPVRRFEERFIRDLPRIQELGLAHYHAWAFGTIRQLGAAFELAAQNLRWLEANGEIGFASAIEAFEQLSNANKTFILKGARAASSRKPFDGSALFTDMANAWARGLDAVAARLG